MGSMCFRLLEEVSILRSNQPHRNIDEARLLTLNLRGSSSFFFLVDIRPSGTDKPVRLAAIAETEVTKRLPNFFRPSGRFLVPETKPAFVYRNFY